MSISRGGSIGRINVARLFHGEMLIQEIKKICKEKNIASGTLQIIGGLKNAELISMQSCDTELKNQKINHTGPFEVIGIGTIATDKGEIVPHIHITLAKYGNESLCGHLVEGEVGLFMELAIYEIEDIHMIRKEDKFGLHLLNFGGMIE